MESNNGLNENGSRKNYLSKDTMIYIFLALVGLGGLAALEVLPKSKSNQEMTLFQVESKDAQPINTSNSTTVNSSFVNIVQNHLKPIRSIIRQAKGASDKNKSQELKDNGARKLQYFVDYLGSIDAKNIREYDFHESVFDQKIQGKVIKSTIENLASALGTKIYFPIKIKIRRPDKDIYDGSLVKN